MAKEARLCHTKYGAILSREYDADQIERAMDLFLESNSGVAGRATGINKRVVYRYAKKLGLVAAKEEPVGHEYWLQRHDELVEEYGGDDDVSEAMYQLMREWSLPSLATDSMMPPQDFGVSRSLHPTGRKVAA